jgi:hypothetical protein
MSMTVTANFSVSSEMVASDVDDTGVLDVGDGTGLSTGDGSELFSGIPTNPTLSLEIVVGTNTQPHTGARWKSRGSWAVMSRREQKAHCL